MDKKTIQKVAQRLDEAERTRTQMRQLSVEFPNITIEDAYAIQRAWVAKKVANGRVIKGHKIGLTSKAMQLSSGIKKHKLNIQIKSLVELLDEALTGK